MNELTLYYLVYFLKIFSLIGLAFMAYMFIILFPLWGFWGYFVDRVKNRINVKHSGTFVFKKNADFIYQMNGVSLAMRKSGFGDLTPFSWSKAKRIAFDSVDVEKDYIFVGTDIRILKFLNTVHGIAFVIFVTIVISLLLVVVYSTLRFIGIV